MFPQNIALQVAANGADYLLSCIRGDGKFSYLKNENGIEIMGKYNLLRHAGCLWAVGTMLPDLPQDFLTSDKEIAMKKLRLGCSYLSGKGKMMKGSEGVFLVQNNFAKLGANALGYLAFNINGVESYRIAQGINFFMDKSKGEIKGYKWDWVNRKFTDFVSEYYPGETALAWAKMGSFGIAFCIITQCWERDIDKGGGILQDHWLLQAIEAVYPYFENMDAERYFLNKYAKLIFDEIYFKRDAYWERSTPIACRVEGLVSYYNISKDPMALNLIDLLLGKLQTFQNLDDEHPCYGAFHDHGKYQIDYTQHAISAFYRYSKINLNEAGNFTALS